MRKIFCFATMALLGAGCSQAEPANETAMPAPARKEAKAVAKAAPASHIMDKEDRQMRGKPACHIRFVYAGHPQEDLFWEEPCKAVTAAMVTQADLQKWGKWSRLDAYAQKFVKALPQGRVLYVEGGFSASIYPIGTTGSTYEVPVTD